MMNIWWLCRILCSLISVLFWSGFHPSSLLAQNPPFNEPEISDTTENHPVSSIPCQELQSFMDQQKSLISREMGQIRREIAALRNDLSNPGIRDIVAGLGYIFGLAGIGMYVSGRKSGKL